MRVFAVPVATDKNIEITFATGLRHIFLVGYYQIALNGVCYSAVTNRKFVVYRTQGTVRLFNVISGIVVRTFFYNTQIRCAVRNYFVTFVIHTAGATVNQKLFAAFRAVLFKVDYLHTPRDMTVLQVISIRLLSAVNTYLRNNYAVFTGL